MGLFYLTEELLSRGKSPLCVNNYEREAWEELSKVSFDQIVSIFGRFSPLPHLRPELSNNKICYILAKFLRQELEARQRPIKVRVVDYNFPETYGNYSKIALIRLIPALHASSLTILNLPRLPVCSTCGPPQNSRLKVAAVGSASGKPSGSPTVYTFTSVP